MDGWPDGWMDAECIAEAYPYQQVAETSLVELYQFEDKGIKDGHQMFEKDLILIFKYSDIKESDDCKI